MIVDFRAWYWRWPTYDAGGDVVTGTQWMGYVDFNFMTQTDRLPGDATAVMIQWETDEIPPLSQRRVMSNHAP